MSQISKQALKVDNSQSFPNNNVGAISPSDLRDYNVNVIDSLVDEDKYNVDSGSWNTSVSALNTFTSSQQPAFNALNSFTASQLNINSGVNSFTQSAGNSIARLNQASASLQNWSASINEIRDDGALQGYSTRLYFNGLVSASVVPNIDGAIANITIQQDTTKLNTSSFNEYTESATDRFNEFTQSIYDITASFANTGSNTFTGPQTINNILYIGDGNGTPTALFSNTLTSDNLYISSDLRVSGSLTASLNEGDFYIGDSNNRTTRIASARFATTGSNTFNGSQVISGSINVSGSVNLLSEGGNGWAFSGKALFLSNSVQTGITVESPIHFYQVNKGDFYIQNNVAGVGSGSMNMIAANNANLNISASNVNTTGNVNITGRLFASASANVATFNSRVLIGGPTTGNTPNLTVSGSDGNTAYRRFSIGIDGTPSEVSPNITMYGNSEATSTFVLGVYNPTTFADDCELAITANKFATSFQDYNQSNFEFTDWLKIPINNGDNPSPIFTRGLIVTGSTTITGSLTLTGSAAGNVFSASIVSNTASIDLNVSNFFQLTLPDGVNTNINILNPKPGTTAIIEITNTGIPSASFSSNVKQQRFNDYLPSSGSATVDLLSVISLTTSSVYVANSLNFV
jgi:hypothetical protein